MKNIYKILALILICQLGACGDDEKQSERTVKIKRLTASSWGHAQVTNTDGDVSGQYENFAIQFTKHSANGFDGTFIISNGGSAFSESSGHWRFRDDLKKIIFDSEKELDVIVSNDHLQLSFFVATSTGKLNGVSGDFTFDLQPL